MQPFAVPENSIHARRPLLAIEADLRRLTDDLDAWSRGDDTLISLALEDAKWALVRAAVALREADTGAVA